jgi:toxin-antitoxin system PIN domain toxin
VIVDANLLLYSIDATSAHFERTHDWLVNRLNGDERVGLPWPSLTAFLRIATHPRASARPLTPDRAWSFVEAWLRAGPAWIPQPTDRHGSILGALLRKYRIGGNLIPDAHLTALAVEHGVAIASADTDFARFTEVHWVNPLAS